MDAKIFKRDGLFMKAVSLFIIQAFIVSGAAFAVPTTTATDDALKLSKQKEVISDPNKMIIPRDAGIVKSKYAGKSGKFIVHIQDAHCNFEAQSNIAKIIETLIKNYNLSFISVEGADGVVDTTWFKAFPDEDVRKEVATYFMKKGEITGPEFLSITTNYPITLFGAETRAYYIENLNAFTSSYPLKEQTEKYYNNIKSAINKLKGYIYSEELKTFDQKMADYESKKLQFNDYVRLLQALAEKHKISLREYADFFKLVNTLIYEKKINFEIVDKERSILIDELSKGMPKDQLKELVEKSLMFKANKISSAEYYDYLKAVSQKNGVEMVKKFPNLSNYIIYNSVYSKIENENLFKDIKKIETAIKESLFRTDDQRTLEALSRHIDILIGLVNIKLLNDDFEYFKTHKEEFSHEYFADFIKKKGDQYGLAYVVEGPTEAVANAIPKLEDFYRVAIKRDNALVENTLKKMESDKQDIGVLVTGGFHSEGIAKLLEKQGVSYAIVCPSITKDVPTPYIQILTNQRTSFEDMLVSAADAKKGLLAPMVIAELAGLSDKALQELKSIVSDGKRIEERLANVQDAWMRLDVELWLTKALDMAEAKKLSREKDVMKQAFTIAMETGLAAARPDGKLTAEDKRVVAAILGSEKFQADFDAAYNAQTMARAARLMSPVTVPAAVTAVLSEQDKALAALEQKILGLLAEIGETTRDEQFAIVTQGLSGEVSLAQLLTTLSSMKDLINEPKPDMITARINAVSGLSDTARRILTLAFLTPGEGAGNRESSDRIARRTTRSSEPKLTLPLQIDEMLEEAKAAYASIMGQDNKEAGYELSLRRLGSLTLQEIVTDSALTTRTQQKKVVEAIAFGKGGIFAFWDSLSKDAKKELVRQLMYIDIKKVQELYKRFVVDKKEGVEIGEADLKAMKIQKPVDLWSGNTPENMIALRTGEEVFRSGEVAFITPAGGSGSRLGHYLPKGTFPASQIKLKSLFRMTAERLAAMANEYGKPVPWIIMTSDSTHDETEKYLNEHIINGKYFNQIPIGQVILVKQRIMPQVTKEGEFVLGGTQESVDSKEAAREYKDKEGKDGNVNEIQAFVLQKAREKARSHIVVGGFGHGDVRDVVLRRDKEARDFLKRFGIKYVMMANVDNVFLPGARSLGYHIQMTGQSNSGVERISMICVEKTGPNEKIGMPALINGRLGLIEYNQVPKGLAFLPFVYIVGGERMIFYQTQDKKFKMSSMEEFQEMLKIQGISEPASVEMWVGKHCVSVGDLPQDVDFDRMGRKYNHEKLHKDAKLWLGAGSINSLIWTLAPLEDVEHPLSDLPTVVASNKAVDGYKPETGEYVAKEQGMLKTWKFECMAFHGFVNNPTQGAVIISDRPGISSRDGGFAPIKTQEKDGPDNPKSAAALFSQHDAEMLGKFVDWAISRDVTVELSPAFAFSDGRYVTNKVAREGVLDTDSRLYLSGQHTEIGRELVVGQGAQLLISVEDEYNPLAEVTVGDKVAVSPGVAVSFTLKGKGQLRIGDNFQFTRSQEHTVADGEILEFTFPNRMNKTFIGGDAVTATGEPLTSAENELVNKMIRDSFSETAPAAEKAIRKDVVAEGAGGLEVYVVPGLAPFDELLVAHPGRGGEVMNHSLERVYVSPARWDWLATLPSAAQAQFWAHERAHIEAKNKGQSPTEDEIRKVAPIDRVLAAIEAERPALKSAGPVSGIDQKFDITAQKDEFLNTLTILGVTKGVLSGQKVILAYDTGLDPRHNTTHVVAIMTKILDQYLAGKQVIVVKGTGRELLDQVKTKRDSLDKAQEKYAVVTLAGDAMLMPEVVSEKDRSDLGRIINVKNNGDKQVPVIGLFDLALRVAYNLGDESILRALNRIALNPNNPLGFTRDDLEELLKRGAITILPKIQRIDTSEAVEAYKSAVQALKSL